MYYWFLIASESYWKFLLWRDENGTEYVFKNNDKFGVPFPISNIHISFYQTNRECNIMYLLYIGTKIISIWRFIIGLYNMWKNISRLNDESVQTSEHIRHTLCLIYNVKLFTLHGSMCFSQLDVQEIKDEINGLKQGYITKL